MGTGMAQVAAGAEFQVILVDVNETALSKAMERIGSGFGRRVAKGQMSPKAKQAAISLIATGTVYTARETCRCRRGSPPPA
jgi:3-hydroxybutyryl-CoA dehydrogenase